MVFNNEIRELSLEMSEYMFVVNSKKEDEKLIFKIIDESGKVAENCAVLRSAWVC